MDKKTNFLIILISQVLSDTFDSISSSEHKIILKQYWSLIWKENKSYP